MAVSPVIIPTVNPLRFTPQVAYNILQPAAAFDLVPQSVRMQRWQRTGACPYWFQPFTIQDTTGLQIAAPEAIGNGLYLELWEVRPDGQTKLNINGGSGDPTQLMATLHDTFAGDVYDNHGTIPPVQMRRHQWDLSFNTILAPIDYAVSPLYLYYFVLVLPSGGIYAPRSLQSEPIKFLITDADKLATIFLAYSHPDNSVGGIFWEMNPTFGFRVDGMLGGMDFGADYDTYQDQTASLRNLSRYTKRTIPLILGANDELIVDWVLDRVNEIMSCKTITINNKRYLLDEGSKFEKDLPGFAQSLKYSASANLREFWPEDASVF